MGHCFAPLTERLQRLLIVSRIQMSEVLLYIWRNTAELRIPTIIAEVLGHLADVVLGCWYTQML